MKTFREFLHLLNEDKTNMIKKLVLPDISDNSEKESYKQSLIDWFKANPSKENKIDWNKWKTLTKADFDALLNDKTKSKNQTKREIKNDPKNLFNNENGRDFKVIGETDNWLFVGVFNWEAAVFCDSFNCGGVGATWCIGTKDDRRYWDDYSMHSCFLLAFNKNFKEMLNDEKKKQNIKYMIQWEFRDHEHRKTDFDPEKGEFPKFRDIDLTLWNQKDRSFDDANKKLKLKNAEKIEEMFKEVFKEYAKRDKEKKGKAGELSKKMYEYFSTKDRIDVSDIEKFDQSVIRKITEIRIPKNIAFLDGDIFENFESLKKIYFENEGELTIGKLGLWDVDELHFNSEKALLNCVAENDLFIGWTITNIFIDGELLTNLTIPKDCPLIRHSYCHLLMHSSIKHVRFEDGITEIPSNMFHHCEKLESVDIPDSVTKIGSYAFNKCESLKQINLPSNLKIIGFYSFEDCNSLKEIDVPNGVEQIQRAAISDCKNIKIVSMYDNIAKLDDAFLYNILNLDRIDIYRTDDDNEKLARYLSKILSVAGWSTGKYAWFWIWDTKEKLQGKLKYMDLYNHPGSIVKAIAEMTKSVTKGTTKKSKKA